MALKKTSELTVDASPALTDYAVVVTDPSTTPVSGLTLLSKIKTLFGVDTYRVFKTISNPQAVYVQRAQVPLFRAPAAITITRIHVHGATAAQEIAGDLKFADDIFTGTFANATVIDVCDTTSGVFTATSSFDDATVPSGKYIYFQLDSSPNIAVTDFYVEFYYTVD